MDRIGTVGRVGVGHIADAVGPEIVKEVIMRAVSGGRVHVFSSFQEGGGRKRGTGNDGERVHHCAGAAHEQDSFAGNHFFVNARCRVCSLTREPGEGKKKKEISKSGNSTQLGR